MRMPRRYLPLLLLALTSAPYAWSAPASASAAAASSAVKPGAITIAAAGITYYAQHGDTLMSIADQFTTRRENWLTLGKLNRIGKDRQIPVGAGILIPAELLADEPSEATVIALSGTIVVTSANGATAVIGLGAKIMEGMQIETGNNGFLTMSLPDASRISLPSNSRVKLAKLRMARYTRSPRTEVMLLGGRVESRVSPLEASKGRFDVRTPLSVAGVRGTHFRVGIAGSQVMNEVLGGKVAVGKEQNSEAVTLPGGKGNIVNAKRIGPAINLLPAPQVIAPASPPEYSAAHVSVVPLAGASGYHVQVATDPDAQNIIAESCSSDSNIQVEGVPDGAFFMRVAAIDKAGLEGFSRTQAFTLKAHAETAFKPAVPSAPYVDDSDDKLITLRWNAQPGKKFNLQVARDADFTWLLFTSNTEAPEARMPRPVFGTYYARIQSINADGSVTPFSKVQSFIVTDHWVINDGNAQKAREARSGAAR